MYNSQFADRVVAKWVRHLVWDQEIEGSSPFYPTNGEVVKWQTQQV